MPLNKKYLINEIYRTIHGEGVRYGIPHIFVRFSQCNLTCGFCDTEFESGTPMTAGEILEEARRLAANTPPEPDPLVEYAVKAANNGPMGGDIRNVLFCGGEPLLQLDEDLCTIFHNAVDPWHISVETNGTMKAPDGVDWVVCSPKVAEHAIRLQRVNELKYVRGYKQGIPRPKLKADHYSVSPIFNGNELDGKVLEWCMKLVENNPGWRLTVQHHKTTFGGIR